MIITHNTESLNSLYFAQHQKQLGALKIVAVNDGHYLAMFHNASRGEWYVGDIFIDKLTGSIERGGALVYRGKNREKVEKWMNAK